MNQQDMNKAVALLLQTKLFESADAAALRQRLESGSVIAVYARGDAFAGSKADPAIGLLLSGKANVKKGRAVISTLEKGALFGAVTLYAGKPESATQITAVSASRVLYIPRKLMSALMAENSRIAENYIAYLSERIYFLTDKIRAFTAGSAESRLASRLADSNEKDELSRKFVTANNLSLLARELDIGRASLYRALDYFETTGAILREGKRIIITDEAKLTINNKN